MTDHVRDAPVEADVLGDFVDAVGDGDGGVARQELGGGGLARARPTDNKKVIINLLLHLNYNNLHT